MKIGSLAVAASRRFTVVVLFLLGLVSLAAFGAEVTATLSGTVKDLSGAVVSSATVTLTNTDTNVSHTVKTDASGAYQFTLVPIGKYRVIAEQAGFKKSVHDGIALSVNQNAKLEIVLRPGEVKEVVEVQGDVTQVDTVSATLGSVETSRRIVDLPLVERDTFQLGILQAGVLPADENDGSGNLFSVSGQRSESLSFLLNGADNNDFLDNNAVVDPNPDAVAEFKILTNNYDAEYGRTAGGIVNQVIKSGSNSVHGSAFEFLRNDAVNARNYFLPSVTPYKRNTFGATIGGPIVRDRTFFFAAYQGTRRHEGVNSPISQTLSPDERSGNFSDVFTGTPICGADAQVSDPPYDSGQLFDPTQPLSSVTCANGNVVTTGTPYNNNQVPVNPVIANYIQKYVPLPNIAGTNNFNFSPPEIDRDDQGILRIDHRFREKDNIYFTYVIDDLAQTIPIGLGGNVPVGSGYSSTFRNQLGEVTWLHTFGTSLVNEAIAGANRSARLGSKPQDTTPPSQLGFTNVSPDDPAGAAPPVITLPTGFFSLGPSAFGPTTLHDVTFHVQDSLSWTHGPHSLKFGADIRRVRNNFNYDYQNNGAFDFGNYFGTFSGNVLADFVGGFWDNYGQFSRAVYGIRTSSFHFFGQDSWKVTPSLTLDFGMRYEYNTPQVDVHNEILGFFPGQQSKRFQDAPPGILYPGDPGTPNNALAYPDRNNFAPRFGFSWDVTGHAKLVVRGGGGIFYDIEDGALNLQFGGEAPFGFVTNISPTDYSGIGLTPGTSGPMADPFTPFGQINNYPSAGKPLAFTASGPKISFAYVTDPHFRTPYAENFNFGFQYQATEDTLVEAYYVGSLSRKSIVTADVNPPLLVNLQNQFNNFGFTYPDCARALAGCADPGDPNGSPTGALALDTNHSAGSSSSNQLQVTVDHRFSRGFNLRGAYTFAKTIDEQSGFRYSTSIFTDPYNWAFDRGLSNFDVTHRLVISGIWQIPFDRAFHTQNSFIKHVADGWQVAGIAQFQSGTPFTIFSNANSSQTGVGFDRADLIGPKHIFDPRSMRTFAPDPSSDNCLGSSQAVTAQFYFDPTAYDCANVQPFSFGNSGKNTVRGPGMNKFDLSLFKTFKFTESKSLEFRTEFFNAFNHARFYNPDHSGGSATFGQLVQAYDPRLIQFALKFYY